MPIAVSPWGRRVEVRDDAHLAALEQAGRPALCEQYRHVTGNYPANRPGSPKRHHGGDDRKRSGGMMPHPVYVFRTVALTAPGNWGGVARGCVSSVMRVSGS